MPHLLARKKKHKISETRVRRGGPPGQPTSKKFQNVRFFKCNQFLIPSELRRRNDKTIYFSLCTSDTSAVFKENRDFEVKISLWGAPHRASCRGASQRLIFTSKSRFSYRGSIGRTNLFRSTKQIVLSFLRRSWFGVRVWLHSKKSQFWNFLGVGCPGAPPGPVSLSFRRTKISEFSCLFVTKTERWCPRWGFGNQTWSIPFGLQKCMKNWKSLEM